MAEKNTQSNMHQDRFVQETLKFLRGRHLCEPGERLLLAVSGGLDSSVLAHAMAKMSRLLGLSLYIAHVDHGLRGECSQKEGAWVKVMGERLNIPVYTLSIPPLEKVGQLELREMRKKCLIDLANELKIEKILTAHHADDNAETILMRAVAGTGINGLQGISPLNGRWLRPLLWASRSELEKYAAQENLFWVEDESNASNKYLRNRLRNELFPLIEEIRPRSTKNLAQLALRIRDEETELERWLEKKIPSGEEKSLTEAFLRQWPITLQRRILRIWMKKMGIDASPVLLEAILKGRDVVHRKGTVIRRNGEWQFFAEDFFQDKIHQLKRELQLNQRISMERSMAWSYLPGASERHRVLKWTVFFMFRQPTDLSEHLDLALSWDKMECSDFLIRPRESKDTSEIEEILAQFKIPTPYRRSWPILCSKLNQQKVFAVVGLRGLKAFRYEGVGRCVSLRSFFDA